MFLQLYLRGGHNASQGWKANAFHYHRLPLFTSYLSELTVFQVVLHLEFSTCFGTFFLNLTEYRRWRIHPGGHHHHIY